MDKAFRVLSAGGPVYCLHELVHNESVVTALAARGLRFVERLDEVPSGATVLFSAHGVSPAVRRQAEARRMSVVDATCPFVARIHRQVRDFAARGINLVVVGHAEHVEVQGVVGEAAGTGIDEAVVDAADAVAALPAWSRVGVVCQTTLSEDVVRAVWTALERRYPHVERPAAAGVCTATRDRQNAVRAFVRAGGDGVLVVGSPRSSNTRRLAEVAAAEGARAMRVGNVADVSGCDFSGIRRLGVTAGASTPESLLRAVVDSLGGR